MNNNDDNDINNNKPVEFWYTAVRRAFFLKRSVRSDEIRRKTRSVCCVRCIRTTFRKKFDREKRKSTNKTTSGRRGRKNDRFVCKNSVLFFYLHDRSRVGHHFNVGDLCECGKKKIHLNTEKARSSCSDFLPFLLSLFDPHLDINSQRHAQKIKQSKQWQ